MCVLFYQFIISVLLLFFFQLEINHPGFSIAHGSLPVTYSLAAVREI